MKRLTAILPFVALLLLPLLHSCSTASAPPTHIPDRALMRTDTQPRPVVPNVVMHHDYYALGDSLLVHVNLEDSRQLLNLQREITGMEVIVRGGSSERDPSLLRDSVRVAPVASPATGNNLLVVVKVPAKLVEAPNVLLLRPRQRSGAQHRIATLFTIPLQQQMLQKDFVVLQATTGKPLFRPYVLAGEKLMVKQFSRQEPVKLLAYNTDFMPALPPMSTRQEPSPESLRASDSTIFAGSDTIRLRKSGLYHLKRGTSAPIGITVQEGAFPQVTKAVEMLAPLIYLTTSEEREYLLKTKDPKATVDEFWLQISKNNDVARGLIKTFYSRVEEANKLYTCHKAGWATDRGMVYIVYGPPSNISRVGTTETWIYRETAASPYVKFVFNKKENTFTQNYYELIRHRDYGESWYSTVARWRAGIADI